MTKKEQDTANRRAIEALGFLLTANPDINPTELCDVTFGMLLRLYKDAPRESRINLKVSLQNLLTVFDLITPQD